MPRQLPPDIEDFTGRHDELKSLCGRLKEAAAGQGTAVVISAVAGMGGVGKSTLAVHVAHRIAATFPDGQLYAELRGTDGRPLEPSEVLDGFLRGLDVQAAEIPLGLEARAGRYRSELSGKRLLVLLDNAHDEAQVRPLLPGSATCGVLITSRRQLAIDGATVLDLGVMTEEDSLDLLQAMLKDERVEVEREAAKQIVKLCGYLPLAVRIAGGQLIRPSRRTMTLAAYAEPLGDERRRLDRLRDGDKDVRAAFGLSYRELPADEARLFRLLGALAGPDFGLGVVAALLEVDEADASGSLGSLVDAQLVQAAGGERYQLHDLLRLFARELLDSDAGEAEAARGRAYAWYRNSSAYMDALRDPQTRRARADMLAAERGGVQSEIERMLEARSRGWFEQEKVSLVASIYEATRVEEWGFVVDLAAHLVRFFSLRGYWHEWQQTQTVALEAARRLGDQGRLAQSLNNMGAVYQNQGRWDDAIVAYEESLAIWRSLPERQGEAQTLGNLAVVYESQRRRDESVRTCELALGIFRDLGDRFGEAQVLGSLGNVYLKQQRWDEAINFYQRSLDSFSAMGDRLSVGQTLNNLGLLYQNQGRFDDSVQAFDRSLAIKRELGDRPGEGQTLNNLGLAHMRVQRWDSAAECFEQSLAIKREVGDLRGEVETLGNLAGVFGRQGRWDEAIPAYDQGMRVFRSLGDRHGEGQILANLGRASHAKGDIERAVATWREALTKLHPDSPEHAMVAGWIEEAAGAAGGADGEAGDGQV